MPMKNKRRIIAWDMWNTIICPDYNSPTYEDILAQYFPLSVIRTLVQEMFMDKRYMSADVMQPGAKSFRILCDQLFEILAKQFPALAETIPDPQQMINQMALAWMEENNSVRWIKNSLNTIQLWSEANPDDIQVLVSNITDLGWWQINQLLKVDRIFDKDRQFLSCYCGLAKPNDALWKMIESKYPNAEFVMIGDSPELDLAAPSRRGWKTLLAPKSGVTVDMLAGVLSA